jgi:hypothetical protein
MADALFALERYEFSATPAPLAPLTQMGARLVAAVHLPDDDVVLALVEGPDDEHVVAAAVAAGWRVDRLIPARWLTAPVPKGLPT